MTKTRTKAPKVKFRWYAYDGSRIEKPGHRTRIEISGPEWYAPRSYAYGVVWQGPHCGACSATVFYAYVERMTPGQVEDDAIGPFTTAKAARREVEIELVRRYGSDA